jgi:RHS repeat-associated protein
MRRHVPLAVLLVLLAPGEPGPVAARKPKPTPCPPGRFLVAATGAPLLTSGASVTDGEAFAVGAGEVAFHAHCPPRRAKIRAFRNSTKVTVNWPACGEARAVRLTARIDAPACNLLRGTLRARKQRPRAFRAVRSTCGDGVLDAAGGEGCDPALGDCGGGATCSTDCRCVAPGTTTTTTTTAPGTTTTATSTTTVAISTSTTQPPPTTTTSTTSTSTTSTTTTTTTSSITTTTTLPTEPPPDPSTVAPPLDPSATTGFAAATAFLYAGPTPVQFNVAPDAIAPERAAVVRGRLATRDGDPLAGVLISILGRPELGVTLSRADGMYDLAVAGGGPLTVDFRKDGFLPAQRPAEVPWQDFVRLPDVILVPVDAAATVVDLTSPAPITVARGSVQADADGTRQATLLFPAGTAAEVVMPDGSTHPMAQLTVRATEYTVGDAGPAAMPGGLPTASGYTYAVELSVDEAMAEGAAMVRFDRALPFYVENFLGFPVGMAVPAGYFDRRLGAWVPSENGRVIGVVGVTGGRADVDVSGDGVADTGAALDALGVTDAERETLAGTYAAGATLWRVPIRHFTPWDCNWPYGPPDDAEAPDVDDPTSDPSPTASCESAGSVIECEAQVLGETIGLAGTPFALHYRSDRVPGRTAARRLDVPLSGATVPASLQAIRLRLEVAGRTHEETFAPGPNQRTTFAWDGLDAYGRMVQGGQVVRGAVEYVYQAIYRTPSQLGAAFAQFGDAVSAVRARQEVAIARPFAVSLRTDDARGLGLGGWTLDVHHAYDPNARILREGNGRRRRAESLGRIIEAVDLGGFTMDEHALAVGPDGSLYFATDTSSTRPVVRRLFPDGTVTVVAGNPGPLKPRPYGDGGPALEASLLIPLELALGPDGSLYIVDVNVVRRVGLDGIITTVAGKRNDGTSGSEGCGGPLGPNDVPATESRMCPQQGIAVAADGTLYIADSGGGGRPRLRRVGPDGIITTVLGDGQRCSYFFGNPPCGDGGPASAARSGGIGPLAFGPDGSLYFSDANVIRRIRPDGVVERVAGHPQGLNGFSGDGGPATSARLAAPHGLDVAPDGTLTFVDSVNERVRIVDPQGIIRTVAGTGQTCFSGEDCASGDGGPALQARLRSPGALLRAPDRGLYVVNGNPRRVRRIGAALQGFSTADIAVPSEDGHALYVFDPSGRHLRSLSALTGATLLAFEYDPEGRLARVVQPTGNGENVTTIERDGAGNPEAVVGPFGDRTTLAVDAEGFLAAVTNPAGETVALGSTADGLLTTLVDPRADAGDPAPHTTTFGYDGDGRLDDDTDPLAHAQTLARDEVASGFEVTRTSPLGHATRYRVETPTPGVERRTVTFPDGTSARSERVIDAGSVTITTADGAVLTHVAAPDPRWDMAAPTTALRALTLPSGLESKLTAERTVTLDDPTDPTSLESLVDEATLAGATTTVAYERATRTFTTTSPGGRTSTVALDALGRPVRLEAPGVGPTVVTYDAHGRLAAIAAGEGATARTVTFGYDAAGRLTEATDPLGRTVHYTHDDAGRLLTSTLGGGRVVSFAYDEAGHLTSLTPPGRPAHGFDWDRRGELVAVRPPDLAGTGPTAYTVDADRRLGAVARPGAETLTLGYDGGGRLASQTLTRNGVTAATYARTYDAAGRLATVTAAGGVALAYGYDGPLVTSRTWSAPVAGAVAHEWDASLRPSSETVGGDEVAFTYDPDGFLTAAGALAVTRDTDSGLPTATTLGVVTDAWTYDVFAATATYDARADGTSRYAATYERDALGRISNLIETVVGVTHEYDYVYDDADRLVEVRRDGVAVEEYGYDANGNRVVADAAGPSVAATYDVRDRLLTRGATTFAHDPSGRLLSRAAGVAITTYTWDAFGQLAGVGLPDGRSVTYLVDGEGRRVGKRIDGVLVQGFLYADALRPVAELDGAGTVVARFVYAGGTVPAYMVKGDVAFRLVTDAAGSVRLVLNAATGAVVQRLDYDAFGNVTDDTNPGFQPFGFAGGLQDVDTGLVHLGVRDYDPETGRWTAPDPIRFAGGDTNLYAYAGNDPVNGADPTGLLDWNSFFAGAALGAVQAVRGLADMVLPGVTSSIDGIVDGVRAIVDLVNGTTHEGDTYDLVLDALDVEALVDRGSPEFLAGQVCGAVAAGAATGGAGAGRGAAVGAERAVAQAANRVVARVPQPREFRRPTFREMELAMARAIDNEAVALERAAAEQTARAAQEGGLELVKSASAGNLQRTVRPLGAGRGRR